MAIYFIFMVVFVVLSDFGWSNKFNITLATLALMLLSGLRYNVGIDYAQYNEIFHWMERGLADFQIEKSPIFAELMKFAINHNLGYQFVIILSAAFFLLGYLYFVKAFIPERYWILSFFLLFSTHLLFFSFNIFRQTFALGIVLLGFTYYIKKKKIWALLAAHVVAFGVHSISAIFLLIFLFWFLLKKEKNLNLFFLIYIVSIICMVVNPYDYLFAHLYNFMGRFATYFGTTKMDRNYAAILKQVVPNVLFLVYAHYYSKNRGIKKEGKVEMDQIIFAGFFLHVVLANFGVGIELLIRIAMLFLPFYIAGTIKTLLYLPSSNRSLFYWGLIVYGFMLVEWVGITDGFGVAQFQWIFDKVVV